MSEKLAVGNNHIGELTGQFRLRLH